MNKTVGIYTLGCKVNQYETQIMIQQFAADGYDIVEAHEDADVYVVNSCTVTSTGDKKTRQVIHRLHRQNPNAVIALTGCYSQAYPAEVAAMEEINVLTGTGNKTSILGHVNTFLKTRERIVDIPEHDRRESFEPMKADGFLERTRAFVKIQDGCEHYCSYCIIPYARGFVRSKPLEDLKLELYNLSMAGFREIVLVGIDLSSYGKDLGLKLIDAILAACTTDGIDRVRLGSLEPDLFSDEDYQLLATLPQFCPQFHLSLQSGSNRILAAMKRKYNRDQVLRHVEYMKSVMPGVTFTCDIIVGFPGETEEDFLDTVDIAKKIDFLHMHIFPFSHREGTEAAKMKNQLPEAVKKERAHRLGEIGKELSEKRYLRSLGEERSVLFESRMGEYFYGHAEDMLEVVLKTDLDLQGEVLRVKLISYDGKHAVAEEIK